MHSVEEQKNSGCGFVIWRRESGHEVTREEALLRIEAARAAGGVVPDATEEQDPAVGAEAVPAASA